MDNGEPVKVQVLEVRVCGDPTPSTTSIVCIAINPWIVKTGGRPERRRPRSKDL